MTKRFWLLLLASLLTISSGCRNEASSKKDPSASKTKAKTQDSSQSQKKEETSNLSEKKTPDTSQPGTDSKNEKLAAEIRKIVADRIDVDPDSLDAKAPLLGDEIGVDELALIDIQISLGNKYDIEVKDNDLGDLEQLTLEKLTEVVGKLQRRKFGE